MLLFVLKFGYYVQQFRILERFVIRSFSFVGFKPSLALLYHGQRLIGFLDLLLAQKYFVLVMLLAMIFRLLVLKVLASS